MSLTTPEDFGQSPPFAPEPDINQAPAPEDEVDVDPENPDQVWRPSAEDLQRVRFDQAPDDLLQDIMRSAPEGTRTAFLEKVQAEFQRRVQASRASHIAFVQKYLGPNAEVKFADVLDGQTYFVSFLLSNPKKQRNIAVPPIMMGGRVEQVRPGKLYACSGKEARMLERVLASKNLEILNITPAPSQTQIAANWLCENYSRLFPRTTTKPRDKFAAYRDEVINEGDDLKTVAINPEQVT